MHSMAWSRHIRIDSSVGHASFTHSVVDSLVFFNESLKYLLLSQATAVAQWRSYIMQTDAMERQCKAIYDYWAIFIVRQTIYRLKCGQDQAASSSIEVVIQKPMTWTYREIIVKIVILYTYSHWAEQSHSETIFHCLFFLSVSIIWTMTTIAQQLNPIKIPSTGCVCVWSLAFINSIWKQQNSHTCKDSKTRRKPANKHEQVQRTT